MKVQVAVYQVYVPLENNLPCSLFRTSLKLIAEASGGYSVERIQGGWVGNDGQLIHEPVQVVTARVFVSGDVPWENRQRRLHDAMRGLVIDQLTTGKQESVMADLGIGMRLYFKEDFYA